MAPLPTDSEDRLVQLPQARIKKMMKQDKEVSLLSADAIFAVTRATELFIQFFAEAGWEEASAKRHKTVQYDDLAKSVRRIDQLEFLTDIVPERIPLKKAFEKKQAIGIVATEDSAPTAAPAEEEDEEEEEED